MSIWLNQYDIEELQGRLAGHNPLGNAANFLFHYMELINSISDGWAYWSYGTKCSGDLQTIVGNGKLPANQCEVSSKDVDKAIRKVVSFLQRCRQTKENPTVLQFIADYKADRFRLFR